MTEFKPAFATTIDTADALRTKKISASELLQMTLDRIERYNPGLKAIIWQQPDHALARSQDAASVDECESLSLKLRVERKGLVDTVLTHRDNGHGVDQAEQPPTPLE